MKAEIVLTVIVLVLAGASLGVLIAQERRHNRSPILALSCRFERADVAAIDPDGSTPGRLSAFVTNNGSTGVRRVVVKVEAVAADGHVSPYQDFAIDRVGAGAIETVILDEAATPTTERPGAATLRYSICATDIGRRRWIRSWNDEVKRDFS